MSALTWEPADYDDRPLYGPPCPGPGIHRWVLRVEDESVSLSSGCEECDGVELYPVLAEVPGRAEWQEEHPVGHCPGFLGGPCEHSSWLRFTPEAGEPAPDYVPSLPSTAQVTEYRLSPVPESIAVDGHVWDVYVRRIGGTDRWAVGTIFDGEHANAEGEWSWSIRRFLTSEAERQAWDATYAFTFEEAMRVADSAQWAHVVNDLTARDALARHTGEGA